MHGAGVWVRAVIEVSLRLSSWSDSGRGLREDPTEGDTWSREP